MTASTSPDPDFTIALDDGRSMNSIIGLSGRVLLDHGQPVYRVIAIMREAREAARIDRELGLAVLADQGFHFTHNGCAYEPRSAQG